VTRMIYLADLRPTKHLVGDVYWRIIDLARHGGGGRWRTDEWYAVD